MKNIVTVIVLLANCITQAAMIIIVDDIFPDKLKTFPSVLIHLLVFLLKRLFVRRQSNGTHSQVIVTVISPLAMS